MKQYSVYYEGMLIESTGYFESVAKVRKYLRSRYKNNGLGLTFRACYPVFEKRIYSV